MGQGASVIHFVSGDPPSPTSSSSHTLHATVWGTPYVFFSSLCLKYKFWTFKSATVNVPIGNITVKKI